MTCSTSSAIERYRGDTWEWSCRVGPVADWGPLTGTCTSHVRRNVSASTVTATWTVTVDDAAERLVTLTIEAANTADIAPGTYVFDVQNVDGDGETHTFGAGEGEPMRLVVKGDVTR